MGTAFIHIGVSKTATTTLQQNVFERLDGILYLGKPGPHERDRVVIGFSKENSALLERTLQRMVTGRICPRDDIETLREAIEKLKSSNAPVIYSNELLCENKYIDFADIAAGLRDIFGRSELVATVRDPQTALPSAYLHETMRFPNVDSSFSKWLDDAIANTRRINRPAESLEQYRYTSMLRQFQTAFDGRITILQYEDLVGNPSTFSQALARLIGGDANRIEALLDLAPKNATRSELFYLYRRFVHRFRSVAPALDLRSVSAARKLNAAVERWTAKLPKKSISLSEYDRARIAQYFPYPVDERDWRR
jgi:Sulfotransferase family